MSKEPRYRSIGLFVIGAAALAAACLIFFGRFKFFDRSYVFRSYFSGSVKGLVPGAPVRFRGAQVGSVRDVSIVYHRDTDTLKIPVLIELYQASVKGISTDPDGNVTEVALVERLIKRGLRAQLSLDSIVTGQLYVQLDFMPSVPIVLNEEDNDIYPEIPTAPSPLDKIQMTLETLPINEIVNRTVHILQKVDEFVSSDSLTQGFANISSMAVELRELAEHIDQRSDVLSQEVVALSKSSTTTLQSLDGTLKDVRPTVRETQRTLEELSAMSRSVRRLADLLERQPESVLLGKD
jgi:paraquat-inducible protein B